jgi:hypothetical protein
MGQRGIGESTWQPLIDESTRGGRDGDFDVVAAPPKSFSTPARTIAAAMSATTRELQ